MCLRVCLLYEREGNGFGEKYWQERVLDNESIYKEVNVWQNHIHTEEFGSFKHYGLKSTSIYWNCQEDIELYMLVTRIYNELALIWVE